MTTATGAVTVRVVRRLLRPVERLLATETASGVVLIAVAALAFLWANSPWAESYALMKHAPTGIRVGAFALEKPLELWVNDLLMAIFFFVVGLEIKRELLVGELAGWRRASLPIVAAAGGMVAPALIYVAFNAGTPHVAGWGVPMATDIAFAVGVLALLGARVPLTLKVFLLALAIVDDLGAVLVIALFYTATLDLGMLAAAGLVWAIAIGYGRGGGGAPSAYVVLGALMWYFTLKSGVHATVAGVLLALTVPLARNVSRRDLAAELDHGADAGDFEDNEMRLHHLEDVVERAQSPLHNFEHALHPWVAFLIMPVFALFNAGVAITPAEGTALWGTATTGAFFGLLIGKPLGIVGFTALAVVAGITRLPEGTGWGAIAGLGLVAGIGFTMALFIANLAFPDPAALDQAKIGVLAASLVAAIAGLAVLHATLPGRAVATG